MSYTTYYPIEGDTLPIMFDTFAGSTGASITLTGLAVTDIEIYKDGTATTRASDAGYTLLDTDGIDFDSITGIHGFSIDLSDNTDSGFYEVGPWYHVVVSAVTVDSQTVSFIAAAFRIVSATRGMAGTALPDAAADAAGGLMISDAGGLDADAMDAIIANLPDSGALTALLSDIADILTDTGTTLDGKLNTIDSNVDAILVDTTNLNDTAIAEITSMTNVPSTPTLRQAVMLLYMWLRNNTQATTIERRILNDAGAEVLDADMTDDGTTFQQGKLTNA